MSPFESIEEELRRRDPGWWDRILQDIPELDIGSGLTSLDAGLRLRYEFVPEFAPYIGVEYQTDLGETRNITQTEGGDPDRTVFLAGVKFWF